jgi:hypothetical protein
MKKIALLFILAISISAHAQEEKLVIPVDDETKMIKFREVIDEEGTKDELFNRCIYWLNSFYKSPTRVTTIRDNPTGKIAGQHQFRVYYYLDDSIKKSAAMVRYTFTIEMKENKYRYTIDELTVKSNTDIPAEKWLNKDDPAYDPRWDEYLQQISAYVKNWSDSLKEKMKPEPEKKADDW